VVRAVTAGALHAWIPDDAGVSLLGDLPDSVTVTGWDGESARPDGIDQVRFYVTPFEPGETAAQAMRAMTRLEVVQAMSAGIEHIAPLVPDGVTFCNARGAHSAATSEWVLAAILAVLRELPSRAVGQLAGHNEQRLTDTLDDKRVTILGYGSIGEAIERRLAGFDVTVTRVARSGRDGVHPVAELDGLLEETDILVILVPLDDRTRGLVSRERLAALPDHALVVNAARGGIIDEPALLEELTAGRLRAALDVSEPDPLPADHPLRNAPGLFYTSHVAATTRRAMPSIYGLIGDQLRRMAAGEPLVNVVDRPAR
jgi:phosphoglycerate dehydrogenase-like enzyme